MADHNSKFYAPGDEGISMKPKDTDCSTSDTNDTKRIEINKDLSLSKFYAPEDQEISRGSKDSDDSTYDKNDDQHVEMNKDVSTMYRAQVHVEKSLSTACTPHTNIDGAFHVSRSKVARFRTRSLNNSIGNPRATSGLYNSHGNTRNLSKSSTVRTVAEVFAEMRLFPLDEENFTSVIAAIFFQDDYVVVALYEDGDSRLQLIDVEGTILDSADTTEGLSGIAASSETSFVALLNDFIELYEIKNSKLVWKRKLCITGLGCSGFGICKFTNDETFAIACEKCILRVNLSGNIIKKISLPKYNLISICVYKDRLIFCDRHSYSVHCIDTDGKEIFTYQHGHLKFPRYISTDCRGFLYVVGELSNNIHRLKHDGTLDSIILSDRHGLRNPRVAVLQEGRNDILLACDDERRLRIYHLELIS